MNYRAIKGDTWDSIAKKTLGSEYAMSELIKANPIYLKTLIFKGGEVLNVPEISGQTLVPKVNPPWVR